MQKKAVTAVRLLMGLIFVVFGLNGFLNFIPQPPPPEAGMAFLGGLASAGYFFPVLKISEIICGLLLLTGRFVPLALIILAPIVLQIVLYHTFLDFGPGSVMAFFLLGAGLFISHFYKSSFSGVLNMNAQPD